MVLGILDSYMYKNEIRTIPNTIYENKLKMDTLKVLEENMGRTLFDINHSKVFFDPLLRVMEIKTKINK